MILATSFFSACIIGLVAIIAFFIAMVLAEEYKAGWALTLFFVGVVLLIMTGFSVYDSSIGQPAVSSIIEPGARYTVKYKRSLVQNSYNVLLIRDGEEEEFFVRINYKLPETEDLIAQKGSKGEVVLVAYKK